MEKHSKGLDLVKNAAVSAILSHAVSVLFLFFISLALSKNEDPGALMSKGAMLAFFIGSLTCGILAGRRIEAPYGALLSGGIYVALLGLISLLLSLSGTPEAGGNSCGMKLGITLGALMLSSIVGLWVNSRRDSRKSLAKQRRKAAMR